MADPTAYGKFEVVPPLCPGTIVLEVSAELALASHGENLRPALMAAIYAALSVDPGDGTSVI
jgi:hypothetical protein